MLLGSLLNGAIWKGDLRTGTGTSGRSFSRPDESGHALVGAARRGPRLLRQILRGGQSQVWAPAGKSPPCGTTTQKTTPAGSRMIHQVLIC